MPDRFNLLPRGERVDDPPAPEQKLRYRVSLALHKYPIQIALVIAMLILLLPLFMLIRSNHDLRDSNGKLRAALINTQVNRKGTLGAFCKVINTNAAAANTQTDYIQGLIIGGVKSSKAFEKTFRQLHLPPYKKRLKAAMQQANGLERLKLPPLDCKKLQADADKQIEDLRKGGTGGTDSPPLKLYKKKG